MARERRARSSLTTTQVPDMQPSMIVHDALAEASNSDELYSLIYEHYQDATLHGPCSHGFNICARLIGSIVIDAIRKYEKSQQDAPVQGDDAENAAANAADSRYTDQKENAA